MAIIPSHPHQTHLDRASAGTVQSERSANWPIGQESNKEATKREKPVFFFFLFFFLFFFFSFSPWCEFIHPPGDGELCASKQERTTQIDDRLSMGLGDDGITVLFLASRVFVCLCSLLLALERAGGLTDNFPAMKQQLGEMQSINRSIAQYRWRGDGEG